MSKSDLALILFNYAADLAVQMKPNFFDHLGIMFAVILVSSVVFVPLPWCRHLVHENIFVCLTLSRCRSLFPSLPPPHPSWFQAKSSCAFFCISSVLRKVYLWKLNRSLCHSKLGNWQCWFQSLPPVLDRCSCNMCLVLICNCSGFVLDLWFACLVRISSEFWREIKKSQNSLWKWVEEVEMWPRHAKNSWLGTRWILIAFVPFVSF